MYSGASWGLLGAGEKLDGWALNCWRGLAGSWSFVGGRGAVKSAGKRTATFNRKLERMLAAHTGWNRLGLAREAILIVPGSALKANP